MNSELTVDAKYDLIVRNLKETIIDQSIAKAILAKRPLKIYWGTAPTGEIHLGYFVPMLKLIDYLTAGCDVTILIADLHAVLDNMKSTFKQVEYRTKYYTIMIEEILKSLGVDLTRLKFVKGSDFQLSKEYTLDMYKAHALITINDAKHAGAEVVKQSDNPKLTGLMYPTLQALDEQYLDVDIQTGGIDQRKIFMHAREILPKLGYKKRFHLMNELVPGLRFEKREPGTNDPNLEKMSASDVNSKISILDTKKQITTKINRAYCLPGDVDDNCLIILLDKIIMPILKIKRLDFVIDRKGENGGLIAYCSVAEVINDFSMEKLHPGDFKQGIISAINLIVDPIRLAFQSKELATLVKQAYG